MNPARDADDNLGLGLKPGDTHYRAFIGPPEDYDLVSAMSFGLLTTLGLRQHHSVVDIGCGSLRTGRLLIPYLNGRGYVGIDPNKWLVKEGIRREVGRSQVQLKKPRFYFGDSPALLRKNAKFDFALAQSIFSHCGIDLIRAWLEGLSTRLADNGALVATFLTGSQDFDGQGWIYPGCVRFKAKTMEAIAKDYGYGFQLLKWKHPRQRWALFSRSEFDSSWFQESALSWNRSLEHGPWRLGETLAEDAY